VGHLNRGLLLLPFLVLAMAQLDLLRRLGVRHRRPQSRLSLNFLFLPHARRILASVAMGGTSRGTAGFFRLGGRAVTITR
jgi:hypothetical protein